VVWGAVPEILSAGFETLVEAGISPEVAYLECVGELKLIAELIEARGIAGMREAISNTAELGAVLGGPRVVDEQVKRNMRAVLDEVRSGGFADALRQEALGGYPRLEKAREVARKAPIERVFSELKRLDEA
jgi:ketol-acid reductoisomerase